MGTVATGRAAVGDMLDADLIGLENWRCWFSRRGDELVRVVGETALRFIEGDWTVDDLRLLVDRVGVLDPS